VQTSEVLHALAEHNLLAGYDLAHEYPELGNALLICSTEKQTTEMADLLVDNMQRVISARV
jgi:glycine dehydrogenase subunit 1